MKAKTCTLVFMFLAVPCLARRQTVFDYGVATKGPLKLTGSIELKGFNVSVESDVYIVSENSNLALEIIGNSRIAGDVHICNLLTTAYLKGGQASIGGETVPEAYDHIIKGIDVEFPVPNPEYFEHYVVDDINYPSTETTFTNVRIPPNTNPSFSGDITLIGVVFFETPNVVTFTGHVKITGIIVGDGDINDDSGTNRIDFLGTVNSSPVSNLPAGFGELRDETGTFLMAPGFSISFGGGFGTINGVIAANGISFRGNAGGIIEGSVLNYSGIAMELSGNSDLSFNRYATPRFLLSPNGDEKLVPGHTCAINWSPLGDNLQVAGFVPDTNTVSISDIMIEYSTNGGQDWIYVDMVPNSGAYDWIVPVVDSNQCIVRVGDSSNTGISDTSDSAFTIFECQQPVAGDLNGDCYVDLKDFAFLAAAWSNCGNHFDPDCGVE